QSLGMEPTWLYGLGYTLISMLQCSIYFAVRAGTWESYKEMDRCFTSVSCNRRKYLHVCLCVCVCKCCIKLIYEWVIHFYDSDLSPLSGPRQVSQSQHLGRKGGIIDSIAHNHLPSSPS